MHYNPRIWHFPREFLPERFDPSSSYYTVPGTSRNRSPSSFMPFSFGKRKCPAENYAMTALKALVAYFVVRTEYVVENVQDEGYFVGLEGNLKLEARIWKKYKL